MAVVGALCPARGVIAALVVLWSAVPAGSQIAVPVPVPSRNAVILLDVITDVPGAGLTYRFRFLAPHIGAGVDYDEAAIDMQYLCDTYALARLSDVGPQPNQIVITLSDRPVPFGEISPQTVQYFEAYTPGDNGCEWEEL